MATRISDVVEAAADAGQDVTITFVKAGGEVGSLTMAAIELVSSLGERTLNDILKPFLVAMGADKVRVSRRPR